MYGRLLAAIRSVTVKRVTLSVFQCAPQPLGQELRTMFYTTNSIARRTYNQRPSCIRPPRIVSMPVDSTHNTTDSQAQAEGTNHRVSEPESAHLRWNALILALTGASQPGSLPSHDVPPCIIMPYPDYIGACYMPMYSLCTLMLTMVFIKHFSVGLRSPTITLPTCLPKQTRTSLKAITL